MNKKCPEAITLTGSLIPPQPNFQDLFESAPGACLVLTPQLIIAAVSDGYQIYLPRVEQTSELPHHVFMAGSWLEGYRYLFAASDSGDDSGL
jgi:hypothetical protein